MYGWEDKIIDRIGWVDWYAGLNFKINIKCALSCIKLTTDIELGVWFNILGLNSKKKK